MPWTRKEHFLNKLTGKFLFEGERQISSENLTLINSSKLKEYQLKCEENFS
jgi:hypothetical protein